MDPKTSELPPKSCGSRYRPLLCDCNCNCDDAVVPEKDLEKKDAPVSSSGLGLGLGLKQTPFLLKREASIFLSIMKNN